MYYATLTQVRQYLKLDTAETGDDTLLTNFIAYACKYAELRAGVLFHPLNTTLYFDVPMGEKLQFDDSLLALTSVTNGDSEVITLTDILYYPASLYPKYGIAIKPSASLSWVGDGSGNNEQVIALAGVWGYHDDYSNAWVSSSDAVADALGLNASVTTINVTSAAGIASDLQSPRFQAGQLIKIDSEYIDIISISTNALTVKRGMYGSTAAVHATAAPITIWRPMGNITFAVLRLVAWRYRQKDANIFDTQTILGAGVKVTPSAVPPDVDALIPELIHLVYSQT